MLEDKFNELMEDFKIMIESRKRKYGYDENDEKTNNIAESKKRILWKKDELMYFVKILYYYVVYEKGESKPASLIDEIFYQNYYIVHESLVTNNNHRTINQLREKFNHMKENWNDTNKWCSDKFEDIEIYIFSKLRKILEEKNLFELRKPTSIVKEIKIHNVIKKITILDLFF